MAVLDAALPRPAEARPALARWAGVAALAQCAEPFFAAWAAAQGLPEPPVWARIAWAAPLAYALWTIAERPRAFAGALRAVPLLGGLIALAALSWMWSVDPILSLRRSLWLLIAGAAALALAARCDWAELTAIAARALALLAAGSAVLALAVPAIGVMTGEHPGAWTGLFSHKNGLGGAMALGVLAGLARGARFGFCLALACLAVLLAAQSTTALLAALAGAAVLACAWLARRGPVAALVVTAAALGAAIIIAAALLAAPDALAALVGRDLTFTGRTEIWRYSLDALAERPFLGHGLEAFWADPDGPAYGVRRAIGWDAPSAHNGWIDLALTLGALGVALFALNFAATLARALPALSQAGPKRFAPAMLAAFFVFTLSESVILTSGALAWALYMAVSARLALDRRQP